MPTPTPPLDSEFWSWLKGLLTAAIIGLLALGFKDIKRKFDTVPELERMMDRLDERLTSFMERINEMDRRLRDVEKK